MSVPLGVVLPRPMSFVQEQFWLPLWKNRRQNLADQSEVVWRDLSVLTKVRTYDNDHWSHTNPAYLPF